MSEVVCFVRLPRARHFFVVSGRTVDAGRFDHRKDARVALTTDQQHWRALCERDRVVILSGGVCVHVGSLSATDGIGLQKSAAYEPCQAAPASHVSIVGRVALIRPTNPERMRPDKGAQHHALDG